MTVNLPDRVKTICKSLNANKLSEIIYTPSSVDVEGVQVNYNGFIASLRLSSRISSLPQLVLPAPDPAASPAELQLLAQQTKNQARKAVEIYLRYTSSVNAALISGVEEFFICELGVYPNKPFFQTGINEYLSDLELHGIEYGWQLIARATSVGYGTLQGTDQITIQGVVIERGAFLLRTDFTPVNVVF